MRIDLDLDEGEALIEEVQSDWIREAQWVYEELRHEQSRHGTCSGHWLMGGSSRRFRDIERYGARSAPGTQAHVGRSSPSGRGGVSRLRSRDSRNLFPHVGRGPGSQRDSEGISTPLYLRNIAATILLRACASPTAIPARGAWAPLPASARAGGRALRLLVHESPSSPSSLVLCDHVRS